MAKELCTVVVKNKSDASLAISRTVLRPKKSAPVKFYVKEELERALAAERNELIEIMSEIPEEVADTLKHKQKRSDRFSKVREDEIKFEEEINPKDAIEPENKIPHIDDIPTESGDTPEIEENEIPGTDESPKGAGTVTETELSEKNEIPGQDTIPVLDKPSREQLIKMTKKEILEFMKNHNKELDGINSRSNATEVTNAALAHFGYDELAEDEKA